MSKEDDNKLIDKSEYFSNLKKAVEERDAFLEEHPKLRPLQKEIEKEMDKAYTPENRMAALKGMMNKRLSQQRDLLIKLKEKARKTTPKED